MAEHSNLVFVGGLHRSGTTPLARILATHPDISGLTGTGVAADEGQHLQSVYPPAWAYGGSGHFAHDERAHLTESSPLATVANADALIAAWSPYWDLSRRILLEKSPPNLVMGRFLQALYPDAAFVMVVRHPVTVALSTRKWTHFVSRDPRKFASLSMLVEHWLAAHRFLAEDLPYLRRVLVVHYEDLLARPVEILRTIADFLGLDTPIPADALSRGHNAAYERAWEELRSPWRPGGWQRRLIERRHADEIAAFGYRLDDLGSHDVSSCRVLGAHGTRDEADQQKNHRIRPTPEDAFFAGRPRHSSSHRRPEPRHS